MFDTIFQTFNRVVERISKISAYVAASLVMPWVIVFFLYIVLRDFFHTSWPFVEEYTEYWLVVTVCLTVAYVMRTKVHVRIDTAVKLLPERARNIMDLVVAVIGLAVSCVLAQHSLKLLLWSIGRGVRYIGGTQSLLWPSYLFVPVGYIFLSLELLVYIYQTILTIRKEGKARHKVRS